MWRQQSSADDEYRGRWGAIGIWCTVIAFLTLVTLILGGVYIAERDAEQNYVQTMCFVMNAQLSEDLCYVSDDSDDSDDSTTVDPYDSTSRRPPTGTKSKGPPTKTTSRKPPPPTKTTSRRENHPVSTEVMKDQSRRNLQEMVPCYTPLWDVRYNISTTSIIPTYRTSRIEGSQSTDYDDSLSSLNIYRVSIIPQYLHPF